MIFHENIFIGYSWSRISAAPGSSGNGRINIGDGIILIDERRYA
jgi:hypothetical protein